MRSRIVVSGLVLIATLLIIGLESHGIVRHSIQSVPVAIAVILALTDAPYARWAAMIPFLIWLLLMIAIFLYVLHIAQIWFIGGNFSPVELVLAAVVALSALFGLFASLRAEGEVNVLPALATMVIFAGLQAGALWWSFQPNFSNDQNFLAWIRG